MKAHSILVAFVLANSAAFAAPPTIEYFAGGVGDPPGTGTWEEVSGTTKSVTVPQGTAVMVWNAYGLDNSSSVRPVIGSILGNAGLADQANGGESIGGTWVTPVAAGSYDVRLQVKTCNACGIGSNGYAWTLIVFPDEQATVPAVSDIGLIVLVALLLGVGGTIIARRSRVVS